MPSENTAVDRRILFNTDLTFTVKYDNISAGSSPPFKWSTLDGLSQFSLIGVFSQVQASINNVSISIPTEDIMAPLLRMCDQAEVSYHNQYTASFLDQNFSTVKGLNGTTINP